MEKELFKRFYLDKEKDIIINLYHSKEDELEYVLETPNHNTGNLISNLAKICNVKTVKNEKGMKVIKGVIPASINGNNEIVYIFRLGGVKIANIFEDGGIQFKAKIPAISKTLMSQTKEYKLPIQKTIVKSYIFKKSKFRTDIHTHMNANLSPDALIALGIKYQIRYPLYYIKKLNLKMSKEQEERILKQREETEKKFESSFEGSSIKGKYLTRKIDDNTFINFADFILNNIENAEYNISKIRASLAILKDGQAVFTNLEKVYLYRYIFCKGKESSKKIKINEKKIEQIPEKDIRQILKIMLNDSKKECFKNISLRQDKLLWIAREYEKQGINYVEIADTELVKPYGPAIKMVEEIHQIMPIIEQETGIKLRFLAALRRIPLTIIKDQIIGENYLRENIDVLKTVGKSPYIVGSDFVGEEINDISDLQPAISEIVNYIEKEDKDFTIRIHAGENDSLKNNVEESIKCVKKAIKAGQKMPNIRIGHGLYTPNLNSNEGKELIKEMKEKNVIVEFQITSNVRLNNLSDLNKHPIKTYLKSGVKCVQGTDGCGIYGVDTIDEQLALYNLLGLTDKEFEQMREVEEELINKNNKYFEKKKKKFEKLIEGKTISEVLTNLEKEYHEKSEKNQTQMRINNKLESEVELKELIKSLPENKMPIIIAGGSFNKKGKNTKVLNEGRNLLENLINQVDSKKVFFVIGHKLKGYEREIIDIIKKSKKKFEIYAIIPKMITQEEAEEILSNNLSGVRISIESDEMGLYKSFNYEIFERRKSIVIAFDGNSPVSNLIQEAKNGKGDSKIYVNTECPILKEKAKTLEGYVIPFDLKNKIMI